jgi:hypothetical protein
MAAPYVRRAPVPEAGNNITDLVREYRLILASHAQAEQLHRSRALAVSDRQTANLELEVRFQAVDYATFRSILQAAAEGKLRGGPPSIEQTINVLVTDMIKGSYGAQGAQGMPTTRIRQIEFKEGNKIADRLSSKTPIKQARVLNQFALSYLVALSNEVADTKSLSVVEGAIIRVRARAQFPFTLPSTEDGKELHWRLDLTVTQQVDSKDASSLEAIKQTMFRTPTVMVPANLLEVLDLSNEAVRSVYRFECEIEFLGPPERRDQLRSADVTAAADAVLQLTTPEYSGAAQYQDEVFRIAQLLVGHKQAEEYRARYGLKKLLPQVRPLTRESYSKVYPPVGWWVGDKANGTRGIVHVRSDGLCRLLGTRLYEVRGVAGAQACSQELLCDVEICGEAEGGAQVDPATFVIVVFEALVVNGEPLIHQDAQKRIGPHRAAAIEVMRSCFGLNAVAKAWYPVEDPAPAAMEAVFKRALTEPATPRPYPVDKGLVLMEPGRSYMDTTVLKWKHIEDTTIDFLARRPPGAVMGVPPYVDAPGCHLHFLFVGASAELTQALGLRLCPGYGALFNSNAPEAVQPPPHGGDISLLYGGRHPPPPAREELDAPVAAGGGKLPHGNRGDTNRGGDRSNNYAPVQFAPSDAPLAYLYQHPLGSPFGDDIDGKVVELRCGDAAGAVGTGPNWIMTRVREDRQRELLSRKYFGNDFRVAESNWVNYLSPFEEKELWKGPSAAYFAQNKTSIYQAQTAFTSFVKSSGIKQHVSARTAVDFMSGRGQDLGRYLDAGIESVVMVDADRAALAELVQRKYSHISGHRGRQARSGHRGTAVHVLAADLSAENPALVPSLHRLGVPAEGADLVVCNLGIHYLAGDDAQLSRFVALCNSVTRAHGTVRITTMMGSRVHELFTSSGVEPGKSWDAVEDGALKYSLRRQYSSNSLTATGQKIGVLLPFSDGGYYEEYLVNTENLKKLFAARGFACTSIRGFDTFLGDFEARNADMAARLSADDKKYVSLYCELVFKKNTSGLPPPARASAAV